jgi:hypothetical protein
MRKLLMISAFAVGLFTLPSIVHAQVVLPVGVGIGHDCQGDDASATIPDGGVSNVLAMKRTQWGPTNNSLVQGVKVWCRLTAGVSQTKLRVSVYDRNAGTTAATSVNCRAININAAGNTIHEETARSGAGGPGSGIITINFNSFTPFYSGPTTAAVAIVECTLPPSTDPNWSSHLLGFYVHNQVVTP